MRAKIMKALRYRKDPEIIAAKKRKAKAKIQKLKEEIKKEIEATSKSAFANPPTLKLQRAGASRAILSSCEAACRRAADASPAGEAKLRAEAKE